MTGICDGRVVVITGAGRGIGRGEALEFARQGARVVVNDVGGSVNGLGRAVDVAESVVAEIKTLGGEAIANADDVSSAEGAQSLVDEALSAFGRLDVVVNNAGILRDKMLFNMSEDDWDSVLRVHLKGTFSVLKSAALHWRSIAKAGGHNDARVINTTSPSGMYGHVGQSNYGAAKGAIASLTMTAAEELGRYGVNVNAISPGAMTRMVTANAATAQSGAEAFASGSDFDAGHPDNVAPLVVWLGSSESKDVTGQFFNVSGGVLGVAERWRPGPHVDNGARWDVAAIGDTVGALLRKATAGGSFENWLGDHG